MSHSVGLVVVVSHERVKSSELHPSNTQLLGCVAPKATDVCSHQRNAKQTELKHRYEGRKTQNHWKSQQQKNK